MNLSGVLLTQGEMFDCSGRMPSPRVISHVEAKTYLKGNKHCIQTAKIHCIFPHVAPWVEDNSMKRCFR